MLLFYFGFAQNMSVDACAQKNAPKSTEVNVLTKKFYVNYCLIVISKWNNISIIVIVTTT